MAMVMEQATLMVIMKVVMVIAINGWVMYTVISVCFGFAFVNDIIVKPKYERYKASYEHYSQQDTYEAMNK